MSSAQHHALSYIEFGVTDLAATRAFYQAAFGWEFHDYGPAYSGIKSPEGQGEIGGFNLGAEPSGTGPLVLLFPRTWSQPSKRYRMREERLRPHPMIFQVGDGSSSSTQAGTV